MKIFVVDQSYFGLLYDTQFCHALGEVGHEVTLIGRELREEEELRPGRYRIEPLFYRLAERARAAFGPKALTLKGLEHGVDMARLIRMVDREKPDIVHFQWIVLPSIDNYFFKSLGRRAPLVLTVHNSVAWHGGASSKLMQATPERVFEHVSHFIPHTQSTEAYLRSMHIEAGRYSLIQHPAVYLPRPNAGDEAKAANNPEQPFNILLFGGLKTYKGIDILIDAAIELAKRRRDFRVVIAGKPFISLDDIRAQIRTAGIDDMVTFDLRLLPDADLAHRIEEADIVVFPYREIDASGAFACASQFGKPVIASAIGTFAEYPAKDHIRLVPPGDVGALTSALEELIGDAATRSRWAERSQALKSLIPSWHEFAQICTGIYTKLQTR